MQYVTLKTAEFMKNGEAIALRKDVTDRACGLHAHDFIEFAYVVSGTSYHIVGGERDNIKKGDFFIFNINVPPCVYRRRQYAHCDDQLHLSSFRR